MEHSRPLAMDEEDDNILIERAGDPEDHEINIDEITRPGQLTQAADFRRVSVPQHRMTPLRNNWETIVKTIVERLKLQIRMNVKKKCVEIRTSEETDDKLNIQRACDFIKAFVLGFALNDAIAMLRLDDLYLESFEIKDGSLSLSSEAAARRAPVAVHRPHLGRAGQDQERDRKRHADAHRAGGLAHPHHGQLRQHQAGARSHQQPDPGQPCGESLLAAAVHRAEVQRHALSNSLLQLRRVR